MSLENKFFNKKEEEYGELEYDFSYLIYMGILGLVMLGGIISEKSSKETKENNPLKYPQIMPLDKEISKPKNMFPTPSYTIKKNNFYYPQWNYFNK